jgi:hypothetical protein
VDPGKVAQLLALMLGPTIAVGALVHLPTAARALRRLTRPAPPPSGSAPLGPPIERLAGDLRRLLAQHEALTLASTAPVRAARLVALRGAITDCAVDAARAVGVDVPPRAGRAPLPVPDLARLLRSLADAGLVLPGHEQFGRRAS